MRSIIILVVVFFCCQTLSVSAQEKKYKPIKLKNAISNADKRKVEKAKKFLNEGKLFTGEKLLIKLRDENMNHAYFHEALIQVQKQILDKIALENPPSDEEGEYFLHGKDYAKPELTLEENFINNGLARSSEEKKETMDNLRMGRGDRKKIKKRLKELKKKSVGKDSVQNPIDAAQSQIDKDNSKLRREGNERDEKSKSDRKNAKKENDLMLIPYKSYANEIIKNCRLATLKRERVDSASHYLRVLAVDTLNYDTLLNAKELDIMLDAQDLYYTRDYQRASKQLKIICDKYANYFPAHLMLGNAYYQIGLDTPTYKQFTYLTQTFSERPEGLEGLSHYFLAKGQYKEAAAAIIKAIMLYPEDGYFVQLSTILKRSGKQLKTQWIRRNVYPLNTTRNYEEIVAKEKSPWRHYQEARTLLHSYTSPKGIIRSNELTAERYLELYAWEAMLVRSEKIKLKEGEKNNFPFARSMKKMGYLDCYIFVSLFHHDMYDAFKDFVELNPDKVEKYFYILLNWEDEKFDKFRVKEVIKTKGKKKKK